MTSNDLPLIFAVGDIHGRDDLLTMMLDIIADEARRAGERPKYLVFLGDYIDRGPESAQVLDRLRVLPGGLEPVILAGNHEVMMAAALENMGRNGTLERWLMNGGGATLRSYGYGETTVREALFGPEATLDEAIAEDLDFIAEMPLFFRAETVDGSLFFVHAGVRPGVPLDQQDPNDLLWIRNEFLSHQGDFGARIVHGHTPVGPEIEPNRVNLDGRAFQTGRLYAGVFDCRKPAAAPPRLLLAEL